MPRWLSMLVLALLATAAPVDRVLAQAMRSAQGDCTREVAPATPCGAYWETTVAGTVRGQYVRQRVVTGRSGIAKVVEHLDDEQESSRDEGCSRETDED